MYGVLLMLHDVSCMLKFYFSHCTKHLDQDVWCSGKKKKSTKKWVLGFFQAASLKVQCLLNVEIVLFPMNQTS